jgi:FtsH-binding integral membrane protein
LAILIALLLTIITCMASGAGITPGTFYVPPLLWAIYFLLLTPVVLLAMKRKNISRPGFIAAVALFMLLNGYCWANLGNY